MVLVSLISSFFMSKNRFCLKSSFFQVIFSHDFTSNSIAYLCQNLFLEVKKPEIKETKGTFIILTFKSSYWGPFSGLKSQDLIKISRIFPHGLFCRRSFCKFSAFSLEFQTFFSITRTIFSHSKSKQF